jgi:hypothetical protein
VVAGKVGHLGPQADGTSSYHNLLDVERHEFWMKMGGKSGIIRGLVPAVVAGQMQLNFTAGSFAVCERDGSNVETDRAYPGYFDATATLQFTAAHATLARIDAVVAAVVDVEDGAQGTGAIGVGAHLYAIPGTAAGSPTAPTDTDIKNFLGRGGFHRLYNQPIAAASTQILLSGATFTGFQINGWNTISSSANIGSSLTAASGWSIQEAKYKLYSLQKRVAVRLMVTRTGADIGPGDGQGNIADVDITTNWPATLLPSQDVMLAIDRSSSASSGNGVSFARARLDASTTRFVLTSLLPGATWIGSSNPNMAAVEYHL